MLAVKHLRVHADDQHLLVVRAIEDPNLAAGRKLATAAPEEVVIELLLGWAVQAVHPHALRVHAAHHVADGPVLARCVQSLKDDQKTPRVLGSEARLILGQKRSALLEQRDALLLLLDAG